MKTIECSNCGSVATIRPGSYEFEESGLSNVVLKGIEIARCRKCGNEDPIIPRVNDLMRALALAVICKPRPLDGSDVRFLRKYVGRTAEEFSRLLNVNKTTVSKWENNADRVGEQSARLIRVLVVGLDKKLSAKLADVIKAFPEIRETTRPLRIEMNAREMSYQYS